jgi:Putative prokaryotic signal transducing protein
MNWIIIYSTPSTFEASAIQGNLESQEVPCIIYNQRDSAYNTFGMVHIKVPEDYRQQAFDIINQHLLDFNNN